MRVSVSGDFDGSNWANVFWVRDGGTDNPSTGDLNDFAAAFLSLYGIGFDNFLSTSWHATGCDVIYYAPGGDQLGGSATQSHTGDVGGGVLPASVACVISWQVQQRYKGGHPRTYLSGIPISLIVSALDFDTTIIDDLAVAANTFLDDVNDLNIGNLGDNHLGTVSFVLRKAWRTPPVFRDFVPGGATVDSRIDTQRRRLGPDRT